MRQILLCLLVLPLYSLAQDCKVNRETDPFTKEVKISSGFLALQNGASVTIDADSKEIDFFFTIPGKCYDDGSTVFIFFDGVRTRSTYRNAGGRNCDGYFHFKYRNTPTPNSILKRLMTQKVAQFVFTGTDKKELIVSLLPEQQEAFMKLANCLTEEAKTLIK